MKHRRTIASTPQRTAKATWTRIIQLISAHDSIDVAQLEAARAVAEASIADEQEYLHHIIEWPNAEE